MSKNQTTYTDEFRRDAVDLYVNSSKSMTKVAGELVICPGSLRDWKRKILGGSGGIGRGAVGDEADPAASAEDLAAEIRRLHKENEYLRRQRDILKKAAAILGENPHASMR